MYPVLFQFKGYSLYTYEVLMWLGIALGWIMAEMIARREGLSQGRFAMFLVLALVGGWLGARLMYLPHNWDQFADNPITIFDFTRGGYAYYGGIFGAIGLTALYLKLKDQKAAVYYDCTAPGLAIGQVFARLGCFSGGCCYGIESETFGLVFSSHSQHIPRIPTQLFESLFGLAVAWWLLKRSRRKKFDGEIIALFLLSYAIFRFFMEFLRDDWRGGQVLGGLSVSQAISLLVLVIVGIFYYRQSARAFKTT